MEQTSSVKKLYRSEKDKIIGGVCGGIGEYFNIDSTLVRLIFILITMLGGSGVVIYIILWIVIPSENVKGTLTGEQVIKENAGEIEKKASEIVNEVSNVVEKKSSRNIGALILIGIGIWFLAMNFGVFDLFDFGKLWPLILVAIGVTALFK